MVLPQSRAAGLPDAPWTHWLLLGPLAGVHACHAPLCCSRTQPGALGAGMGLGVWGVVGDGGCDDVSLPGLLNKALKWGVRLKQQEYVISWLVLEAGRPKPRCRQGWLLLRTGAGRMCSRPLSLACRHCALPVSLHLAFFPYSCL